MMVAGSSLSRKSIRRRFPGFPDIDWWDYREIHYYIPSGNPVCSSHRAVRNKEGRYRNLPKSTLHIWCHIQPVKMLVKHPDIRIRFLRNSNQLYANGDEEWKQLHILLTIIKGKHNRTHAHQILYIYATKYPVPAKEVIPNPTIFADFRI